MAAIGALTSMSEKCAKSSSYIHIHSLAILQLKNYFRLLEAEI